MDTLIIDTGRQPIVGAAMQKFKSIGGGRSKAYLFAGVAALLLSSCELLPSADRGPVEDIYVSVEQQYAPRIQVGEESLPLTLRTVGLSNKERRSARDFMEAAFGLGNRVTIHVPTTRRVASQVSTTATELRSLASELGKLPNALVFVPDRAGRYGADAMVMVATVSRVLLPECGDYTSNVFDVSTTANPSPIGCAFYRNHAAIVAVPGDFLEPREIEPSFAEHELHSVRNFITGKIEDVELDFGKID